ncbi:MAG: GldG family protein [Spirochaetota bacterium]
MIRFFHSLNNNKTYMITQYVLLFLVFNYFLSGWNCRQDMSKSNRFELTESTEKILKTLPETLFIDAFYSTSIPSEYKARINLLKELLKEIASTNTKKVSLRFHDPDTDEEQKKKADQFGIRPLTIQKVERGSAQVKSAAYFGLHLTIGAKSETIPVVVEAEKVEYQLLSTLRKMLRKSSSSGIGLIKATGGMTAPIRPGPETGKDTIGLFVRQAFEPEYGSITEVNINEEDVPEEITTLILAGSPRLSPKGKFYLDQFITKGGSLVVLSKTMDFTLQNQQQQQYAMMGRGQQSGLARPTPNANELNNFFKGFGFSVKTNMILEKDHAMPIGPLVQIEPGVIGRYHYPVWLIAYQEDDGINKDSIYTKNTEGLLLPWASEIELFSDKQKGVKSTVLVQSTEKADIRKDFVILSENQLLKQEIKANGKRLPLLVLLEGSFTSTFSKQTLPDPSLESSFVEKTPEKKSGKIVVSGTPYLIADILAMNRDATEVFQSSNIPFFLNLLDTISGDTDLLAARSKRSAIMNLKPVEKSVESIASFMNVGLFPLLLAAFAFRRLKKRNKAV